MTAPTALLELVARFRDQLPDYRRGAYNETQLRRDFLDPLFALLGWDVDKSGRLRRDLPRSGARGRRAIRGKTGHDKTLIQRQIEASE